MWAGEFTPFQLRAVVFTPSLHQLPVATVAGELLRQLPGFSGDPLIMPIPAEAPGEIPRIVLKDPVGQRELQVAISRSDLYVNRSADGDMNASEFFEDVSGAFEVLSTTLGVRPGRLAATGVFYLPTERPAEELASHFCKDEWVAEDRPFNGLRAFEIHAHRRIPVLEGLVANSWVRFKTGSVSEGGISLRAVVVERDVNTLQEEAEVRAFGRDDVANFFREAGASLRAELELYR